MKLLYRDTSRLGVLELRLNDKGELEAKMDLTLEGPLGEIKLEGILNAEEIVSNVKHSLALLMSSGVYELNLKKDNNKEQN